MVLWDSNTDSGLPSLVGTRRPGACLFHHTPGAAQGTQGETPSTPRMTNRPLQLPGDKTISKVTTSHHSLLRPPLLSLSSSRGARGILTNCEGRQERTRPHTSRAETSNLQVKNHVHGSIIRGRWVPWTHTRTHT